jgi:2,3-bisphosphoglycerate-independent phosphoglycerate mutase
MREYGVGKVASSTAATTPWTATSAGSASARPSTPWSRQGRGRRVSRPVARIKENYNNGITDEFSFPLSWSMGAGKPVGQIRDEDVCINFNFRADRARQITRVLARESGLNKQGRPRSRRMGVARRDHPALEIPKNLHYLCMTQYDKLYELPLVIPPESMDNILANVLGGAPVAQSARGRDGEVCPRDLLLQRRHRSSLPRRGTHSLPIAQGGHVRSCAGDEGRGIGDTIVKAVNDTAFDLIVANFANADMVGHSGQLEPTIRACEFVTRSWAASTKPSRSATAHGSSPPTTATPS